jgi:group I intron endonuclease
MIGIYKITNPKGKVYIGQSTDIEKRKKQYQNLEKEGLGPKIFNSIKSYGWEQHIHEIIEECSLEQLDEREIYWGQFHQTLDSKFGLNLRLGKGRGICSEETKDLIRLKATGRKLSNEAIEKIRQSKIGNKYNLGRKHSEETKQSPQYKNRKKGKITPERNKKIKEKLQKPIIQCDLKNNFIKEWSGQTIASQMLNINQPSISNCLKNRSRTAGGYIWKYKN